MKPRVFLCVDGQNVTGPFSLDELRLAVSRHEIAKATLGCQEGSETWQPLGALRPEVFKRPEKTASPKQKALLAYLGYPSSETATSAEARVWLDAACEDESKQDLLNAWHDDKLRLHPGLFAEDSDDLARQLDEREKYKAARQAEESADRPRIIWEFCDESKSMYEDPDPSMWPLHKLTLKQCKLAVDWLDRNRAGWEANLYDKAYGGIVDPDFICTTFVEALRAVAPGALKKQAVTKSATKAETKQKKRGCLWLVNRVFLVIVILAVLSTCSEIFKASQKRPPNAPAPSPQPSPAKLPL
jgi:hypothetical protein